ncbi:hypothetical protein R6Q59_030212 [Mikania micrantha]|uniref:DUF1639 domain-containing protein n=1 Tax=Mikania micrantha TaxID=192012 RepID=A0A5N6LRR4_9ASTR|nr:hypothetical protein E3N88_37645 [Mikania micrantha]
MVFSGEKRGGGERESAKEDMERLKPLHNFDFPYLKWGNQKLLRCMKVDARGEVSVADRNQSSDSGADGGGGGGSVIVTRKRDSEFDRRFRSSDDHHHKLSSSEKMTARIGVAGDGEIEATREKLMFDFQTEVGKMKDAILGKTLKDPPPPATATTSFNSPADRPWNLRTRRAACKAPRSPTNGTGEVLKPNSSLVSNECKNSKVRPKFSVSLSRHELEEDFMAMTGRRLPRKPKKRPRVIQKQLDTLFPGLWLSEITADLYKVPDEAETSKR